MIKKGLLLIVLTLSLGNDLLSQSFFAMRREHDLIVSAGTGSSTYFGEFQNPGDNFDAKPSMMVGLQMQPFPGLIQNRISARSELTWFYLKGSDANANDDRVERNLSFTSSNWELNTVGLLHALPQDIKFYQRAAFNFYGFVGVGLLYMNPKAEYQGQKYALQPLQTEAVEYSRFQFVIPYGLGLKVRSGALFNVALEAGWRKTFTDYMDDASGRGYPDPAILSSDLSRALSDRRRERDPNYPIPPGSGIRGNPESKDSYMFFNIKLEYYLPIDLKHNDRKLMNVKRYKPRRR